MTFGDTRNDITGNLPCAWIEKTSQLRGKLGSRVRFLRSNSSLTQEQLAERAGISVDFLSLIEPGKNSPTFDNLDDLAYDLSVSVAELFSFTEVSPKAH